MAITGISAHADYQFSDSHLHIVDFFQEGEPLPALLQQMDKHRISDAMITGVPLMKKWHEDEPRRPRYYSGDDADLYWYSATDNHLMTRLQKLPQHQRQRLHPFISGFNPTDKNADKQLRRLLKMYPDSWQGIGEVLTRHDDLTALTQGEPPRANNEAMQRVYRVAAEFQLPVLLHSNITSKREKNPLYLGELEDALASNPDVNIIWAHAGTSKTLHRYQGKMDFLLPSLKKLLAQFDNLYVDISWTVLEPYILDKDQQPDAEWLALIKAYPRRFMIGSDALGQYDNIGKTLTAFAPLLDALPPATSQNLAQNNFLRLLPRRENTDKHQASPK